MDGKSRRLLKLAHDYFAAIQEKDANELFLEIEIGVLLRDDGDSFECQRFTRDDLKDRGYNCNFDDDEMEEIANYIKNEVDVNLGFWDALDAAAEHYDQMIITR